jgi:hypothetical protein
MSPAPSAKIAGIYRYPVKGLTPEPLPRAALSAGQTLVSDRRYAIENGPSGFDPAEPKWLPKPHFLMLQRDEWLASLATHFDDESHVLTIRRDGEIAAQGDLETAAGRAAIEQFFARSFAGEIKGPPKVLTSPGHSFSDVARKVVSIINLASLRAIENLVDHPVHPLRFRANLYVEGWPAWREFDLLDGTLAIGEARLRIVNGSPAAPPSMSIPTPPRATLRSRRRCSAGLATTNAASMPKWSGPAASALAIRSPRSSRHCCECGTRRLNDVAGS